MYYTTHCTVSGTTCAYRQVVCGDTISNSSISRRKEEREEERGREGERKGGRGGGEEGGEGRGRGREGGEGERKDVHN